MDEIVRQLVERVNEGRSIEEVIDNYIDTATAALQQRILDEIGDVDLSEPMPDLRRGWSNVRGQLAYNALYHAVSAALRS